MHVSAGRASPFQFALNRSEPSAAAGGRPNDTVCALRLGMDSLGAKNALQMACKQEVHLSDGQLGMGSGQAA